MLKRLILLSDDKDLKQREFHILHVYIATILWKLIVSSKADTIPTTQERHPSLYTQEK